MRSLVIFPLLLLLINTFLKNIYFIAALCINKRRINAAFICTQRRHRLNAPRLNASGAAVPVLKGLSCSLGVESADMLVLSSLESEQDLLFFRSPPPSLPTSTVNTTVSFSTQRTLSATTLQMPSPTNPPMRFFFFFPFHAH